MRIIPVPKTYVEHPGGLPLSGLSVVLCGDLDRRLVRAAVELQTLLTKQSGGFHKLYRSEQPPADGAICLRVDATLPAQGYHLTVSSKGICLTGGDAAGCFYAVQTLRQLLSDADKTLPFMEIEDQPDMAHRGFYHDVTRGRVPTLDAMKGLVDRLAAYKVNSLQLYVEHTYPFAEFADDGYDCLTAEELLELDQYCYDRFIDFIPSLSTFGHLYELLSKSAYQHLCELENYEPPYHFWLERMRHHTIDATNPESLAVVCSLIDQYLPLFRSSYFNICCDETFDLGTGRNAGKDKVRLYIDFVNKIIAHVRAMGKTPMMWGDIALNHPDILQELPAETILLNWDYGENPSVERIDTVRQTGRPQIVCPGTWSWLRLIEQVEEAEQNIAKMIRGGFANGALGVLNTNWGDHGHPASPECALYGTLLGAALGWRTDTVLDEAFDTTASRQLYGCKQNIIPQLRAVGAAQKTGSWGNLFWYKAGSKDAFGDCTAEQVDAAAARCEEIAGAWESVDGDPRVMSHLIVAARGVALLNKAVARILRGEPDSENWTQEKARWLASYESLWLADSKPSELQEIRKFVESL